MVIQLAGKGTKEDRGDEDVVPANDRTIVPLVFVVRHPRVGGRGLSVPVNALVDAGHGWQKYRRSVKGGEVCSGEDIVGE